MLAVSLSLIGCEDAYSSLVQYPLRTDPVATSDKFGDDQVNPDRPGIFPILSIGDLSNPLNPMFPAREKILNTGVLRDPTAIKSDDQRDMKETLDSFFGTPRTPKVKDAPSILGLENEKLARGAAVYRVQCLHCHGVAGDGRGVTARWVNPHPRDFRQGLFKFQSVDQVSGGQTGLPPRREDIKRTLLQGVEGTAMPAFNLLDPKDIDALVSYVIHLSIRGQVEYDTIKNGFTWGGPSDPPTWDDEAYIPDYMKKMAELTMKKWVNSQSKAIKIKPYPFPEGVDNPEYKASVQRGWKNFIGQESKETPNAKGFNCVSCHVNYGRQSAFKWDSWGTLAKPNNLTNGIYRGGRRTVDIYYRIHSGINGSNMPAFGMHEAKDDRSVWDLVNFVQVLPFPAMREKLGVIID